MTRGRPLHSLALATAAAAFGLLVAGGLVTSTGSGLAVPDWPLSFGRYFPPMTGGVLFEHGHRMIAGAVGAMTLVLAAWFWLREPRGWVRGVAAAAAAGIVLQALLGGATVLFRLPAPVSIAHACLGQAVFCLLVVLAEVTSGRYGRGDRAGASPAGFWRLAATTQLPPTENSPPRGGRISDALPHGEGVGSVGGGPEQLRLAALCVLAVYVQLILGAILRHADRGLGPHLVWACVAGGLVYLAAYRAIAAGAPAQILRPAAWLLGLVLLQMLLGLAALAARAVPAASGGFWRAALPTAHVACGAWILGLCVVWTLRAYHLPAEA